MKKNIYSICVRTPHSIKLCPNTRNSLFYSLREKTHLPLQIDEKHINFNDSCPLHNLNESDVWSLISSRGFFTVGLSFIHPDTNCLWQGLVQFTGNPEQQYYRARGRCYKGYAEDLMICIEHSIIPTIESRDFINCVEGKDVRIHVYTPVLFDEKL